MRALITGIGGFVGGHLAILLQQEGFEVWGIDLVPVSADAANSAAAIELGDVCDPVFTNRVVRDARPTHVFHLATTFSQKDSAQDGTTDSNVLGVSVLLDILGASARHARIMIASSSAVYGAPDIQPINEEARLKPTTSDGISHSGADRRSIDEEAPLKPTAAYRTGHGAGDRQFIDEEAPLKPATAYGTSKTLMETAAVEFRTGSGMNIFVARTFNLLGPGMPRRLFAGSLAAQIAAAERGGSPTIKVGRLDSSRDYVDVRDAVRAYLALAIQPAQEPWVFNVCSGVSRSCQEVADEMFALARVPVTLDYDASRLQSGDVDRQLGSAARLRRATGWMPAIAFSTSVRDTLDHERNRGV